MKKKLISLAEMRFLWWRIDVDVDNEFYYFSGILFCLSLVITTQNERNGVKLMKWVKEKSKGELAVWKKESNKQTNEEKKSKIGI